jgi:hypothetical protein
MTPLTADVASSLQHTLDITVHIFSRIWDEVIKRQPQDLFGSVTEQILIRSVRFQYASGVDVDQDDPLSGSTTAR